MMIYASDLPIGARFKLVPDGETWVLLDDRGSGLMAVWAGLGPLARKPLYCSVAPSRDKFKMLRVFDVK